MDATTYAQETKQRKAPLTLAQAVAGLPITEWSHADKIRFFAWFLVRRCDRQHFTGTDIGRCYDELDLQRPTGISPFLNQMSQGRSRQLLRNASGYRLERSTLGELDARFGAHPNTVHVRKLLEDLPAKVPDVAEREFLDEALICFRNQAFRAAIVMCWNLAFDHLLNFVLKHHLAKFNAQWATSLPKRNQKARVQQIGHRDDFSELKESEVLTICKGAAIINPDVYKILDEKLDKRNTAAHPSTAKIGQIQAEGVIDDLVTNVILKLPL